jgi:hypothetical protein
MVESTRLIVCDVNDAGVVIPERVSVADYSI